MDGVTVKDYEDTNMELKISLKTREDIERFILISNIGLTAALKSGSISIREAERYLYTPYSVKKLENLEINEDVVMLVKLGCELEDVESLIPDKLKESIERINDVAIRLLSSIPTQIQTSKKWID